MLVGKACVASFCRFSAYKQNKPLRDGLNGLVFKSLAMPLFILFGALQPVCNERSIKRNRFFNLTLIQIQAKQATSQRVGFEISCDVGVRPLFDPPTRLQRKVHQKKPFPQIDLYPNTSKTRHVAAAWV